MFRQVAPAPCSPPLGGSIADSAVRFTPAESRAGAKTGRPAAKLECVSKREIRKFEWIFRQFKE